MSSLVNALGPEGFGVYRVDLSGPTPEWKREGGSAEDWIVPGFVDIHIHGGFGVDVMSSDTGALQGLCRKLAEHGYEGFLATTVTASVEATKAAISRLPENALILGFHLEGPFISDRYPGAQPQNAIVDPPTKASDWDELLDNPALKVLTMAPERPGALEMIERLSHRGVRVGMGHTNATFAEAKAGFEKGARHCTHTYNAMRPLHHREAGTVGFALLEDGLRTELIYDRLHVCREAAQLLIENKPKEGILAVSDGTMASGMAPNTPLVMWGLECVVGEKQVRLKDGTLAGSGITLNDAFANLADDFGGETAVLATSLNPRRHLGLSEQPRVYVRLNKRYEVTERFEVEDGRYRSVEP